MTPEGSLTWVAQSLAAIISILGPEMILLSCKLIVEAKALVHEVGRYIPKQYIPEIIQIDNVKDYMMLGQMILCTEAMENR